MLEQWATLVSRLFVFASIASRLGLAFHTSSHPPSLASLLPGPIGRTLWFDGNLFLARAPFSRPSGGRMGSSRQGPRHLVHWGTAREAFRIHGSPGKLLGGIWLIPIQEARTCHD